METVVLCGGLGMRLRSVIGERQKTVVDVDGRPFLRVLLEEAARQGVRRAVLCTGYRARDVEEALGDGIPGMAIVFSRETEPRGTAGALKLARPHLREDPFFVMNGDSLAPVDLKAMRDLLEERRATAVAAVSPVEEAADFGTIELAADGRILAFREKAPGRGGYVNAGVYCFRWGIFRAFPQDDVCSLERDVFPRLVAGGFYGYPCEGPFLDIGTPERLTAARGAITRRTEA